MQQQHLAFSDIPCPHENVWAPLNNERRKTIVEVLARLIAQAALHDTDGEDNTDV